MKKPTKTTVTMDTVICDYKHGIYGKVSELAKKNGTFTYRRKTYVFLEEHAKESWREAIYSGYRYAVRLGDVIKLKGKGEELLDVPMYKFLWTIPISEVRRYDMPAEELIDWDKPNSVRTTGENTYAENPEYKLWEWDKWKKIKYKINDGVLSLEDVKNLDDEKLTKMLEYMGEYDKLSLYTAWCGYFSNSMHGGYDTLGSLESCAIAPRAKENGISILEYFRLYKSDKFDLCDDVYWLYEGENLICSGSYEDFFNEKAYDLINDKTHVRLTHKFTAKEFRELLEKKAEENDDRLIPDVVRFDISKRLADYDTPHYVLAHKTPLETIKYAKKKWPTEDLKEFSIISSIYRKQTYYAMIPDYPDIRNDMPCINSDFEFGYLGENVPTSAEKLLFRTDSDTSKDFSSIDIDIDIDFDVDIELINEFDDELDDVEVFRQLLKEG